MEPKKLDLRRLLASDSLSKREVSTKLYVMDSTTRSLFSQRLSGVGRKPNNGKKKGGIKAHAIIEESIDLPVFDMLSDKTGA